MTFSETSVRGSSPCRLPESDSATSSRGTNRSVSNTFATSWSTTATRSTLEPVSMFFAGSSPSTFARSSTSSCMKTWFQISM